VSYIILIEDHSGTREAIRTSLASAGHRVSVGGNGAEGLAMHAANPADLIITDIVMPDSDGLKLIGDLRRRRDNVKILAISGGGIVSGKDYLRIAMSLGATATMEKPFEADALLLAVRTALSA
jgi:DNA-binding NtrC family response regulator